MSCSDSPGSTFSPAFSFGLDIQFQRHPMNFRYGPGVLGPAPEYRWLDAIRASLRNPDCAGPDPVYAIAMDVCRREDLDELKRRMLLFGIVIYAGGQLGDEPVRSQGHVHSISPHCGWSTPELFEVWEGRAIIYGQEKSGDDPGKCIAIEAGPGERVVMPPGWAHFVANATPASLLIFGAWCDRQYGFDYTQMRAHHGLAWFPILTPGGKVRWEPNSHYSSSKLQTKAAREYPELGISGELTIYRLIQSDPESIQWVSEPQRFVHLWKQFEP